MPHESRLQVYERMLAEIRGIVLSESDAIARQATVASILFRDLNLEWVGFYRASGEELILGPFQGPPVCTRIAFTAGVCGTAARTASAIVVPDVREFPGYIQGSGATLSEITVPLIHNGSVELILDADSSELSYFSGVDTEKFREILAMIQSLPRGAE